MGKIILPFSPQIAQRLRFLNLSHGEPVCLPFSLYPVLFYVSPPTPSFKTLLPSLHDSSLIQKIPIVGRVGAALTFEPIPETAGVCSQCPVEGPPPHTHTRVGNWHSHMRRAISSGVPQTVPCELRRHPALIPAPSAASRLCVGGSQPQAAPDILTLLT